MTQDEHTQQTMKSAHEFARPSPYRLVLKRICRFLEFQTLQFDFAFLCFHALVIYALDEDEDVDKGIIRTVQGHVDSLVLKRIC